MRHSPWSSASRHRGPLLESLTTALAASPATKCPTSRSMKGRWPTIASPPPSLLLLLLLHASSSSAAVQNAAGSSLGPSPARSSTTVAPSPADSTSAVCFARSFPLWMTVCASGPEALVFDADSIPTTPIVASKPSELMGLAGSSFSDTASACCTRMIRLVGAAMLMPRAHTHSAKQRRREGIVRAIIAEPQRRLGVSDEDGLRRRVRGRNRTMRSREKRS
mmetsp:Transcript_36201/g.85076  ORF Transcript_36201/g.85076 Transcript_36201/m.85076 type:complete len:221 (-) Transcript_36201:7-669(-)